MRAVAIRVLVLMTGTRVHMCEWFNHRKGYGSTNPFTCAMTLLARNVTQTFLETYRQVRAIAIRVLVGVTNIDAVGMVRRQILHAM